MRQETPKNEKIPRRYCKMSDWAQRDPLERDWTQAKACSANATTTAAKRGNRGKGKKRRRRGNAQVMYRPFGMKVKREDLRFVRASSGRALPGPVRSTVNLEQLLQRVKASPSLVLLDPY